MTEICGNVYTWKERKMIHLNPSWQTTKSLVSGENFSLTDLTKSGFCLVNANPKNRPEKLLWTDLFKIVPAYILKQEKDYMTMGLQRTNIYKEKSQMGGIPRSLSLFSMKRGTWLHDFMWDLSNWVLSRTSNITNPSSATSLLASSPFTKSTSALTLTRLLWDSVEWRGLTPLTSNLPEIVLKLRQKHNLNLLSHTNDTIKVSFIRRAWSSIQIGPMTNKDTLFEASQQRLAKTDYFHIK